MINAYIIAPKNLKIRTDNSPILSPLAFSASQINPITALPYGLIAVRGKAYVGSPDELPVFVRYKDGHVDILEKPEGTDVAYADFVISGTALLVSENQPRDTTDAKYTRPFDDVKRVVIGVLEDGNVFVVFCNATIQKLKDMLCAYGVHTGILLSSDNVYFSNPRSGIGYGDLPVMSMQATYYEEVPTPIIAIDPAHGGKDLGYSSGDLNEKEITLTIAREIRSYLNENYYGTFILTRSDDNLITLNNKIQFVNAIQADLVYTCHVNASDGMTRGMECFYNADSSESTHNLVKDIYTRVADLLSVQGIKGNGLHPKQLKLFEAYPCPAFIAKILYIDNVEDAHMLEKPEILHFLAVSQAEALAQALGLSMRVNSAKIAKVDNKLFKVNIAQGQFKFKMGALALCDRLRQHGFDAYITRE